MTVEFSDDDAFLRGINPDWVQNGIIGSWAFSNDEDSDRLSMDWAQRSSAQQIVKRLPGYGVASITYMVLAGC